MKIEQMTDTMYPFITKATDTITSMLNNAYLTGYNDGFDDGEEGTKFAAYNDIMLALRDISYNHEILEYEFDNRSLHDVIETECGFAIITAVLAYKDKKQKELQEFKESLKSIKDPEDTETPKCFKSGCEDCRFVDTPIGQEPCSSCCHSYLDQWRKASHD